MSCFPIHASPPAPNQETQGDSALLLLLFSPPDVHTCKRGGKKAANQTRMCSSLRPPSTASIQLEDKEYPSMSAEFKQSNICSVEIYSRVFIDEICVRRTHKTPTDSCLAGWGVDIDIYIYMCLYMRMHRKLLGLTRKHHRRRLLFIRVFLTTPSRKKGHARHLHPFENSEHTCQISVWEADKSQTVA